MRSAAARSSSTGVISTGALRNLTNRSSASTGEICPRAAVAQSAFAASMSHRAGAVMVSVRRANAASDPFSSSTHLTATDASTTITRAAPSANEIGGIGADAPLGGLPQFGGLLPEIFSGGRERLLQDCAVLGFGAAAVLLRAPLQRGDDPIRHIANQQLSHARMIARDSIFGKPQSCA